MNKLSRKQIQVLVQACRKAFLHAATQARARGVWFDDSPAAFDAYRHALVMAACGKPGLTHASNDDFNLILAECQTAIGADDKALNSLLNAGTEKVRQLRAVLWGKLESAGLPAEYGQSIAIDRWGSTVEDLTEPQLKQILFTVVNRIRAKAKRHATPNPEPETRNPEPAPSPLHDSTLHDSTL